MPTACSSAASARANRAASASSPLRARASPSAATRVNGPFSRATRPPSWSTLTHSGSSCGQRLRLAREVGDLLGLVDVAGEEDHAAEIELAGERLELRRDRVAGEAGDRQLTDVPSNVAWKHCVRYDSCRAIGESRCYNERYRAHRRIRADAHRSRRRHARHLAALSVSRRRADAERRDQPARALHHPLAVRSRGSSSSRTTPAQRVEVDHW